MGIFTFLKGVDINDGVREYENTPGAVLLDVRTAGEFARGHIPGAINVPVQDIEKIGTFLRDKNSAVFIYCLSGARSRQAAAWIKSKGYSNVTDIGGIGAYKGRRER